MFFFSFDFFSSIFFTRFWWWEPNDSPNDLAWLVVALPLSRRVRDLKHLLAKAEVKAKSWGFILEFHYPYHILSHFHIFSYSFDHSLRLGIEDFRVVGRVLWGRWTHWKSRLGGPKKLLFAPSKSRFRLPVVDFFLIFPLPVELPFLAVSQALKLVSKSWSNSPGDVKISKKMSKGVKRRLKDASLVSLQSGWRTENQKSVQNDCRRTPSLSIAGPWWPWAPWLCLPHAR